jgi:hypothetical protein
MIDGVALKCSGAGWSAAKSWARKSVLSRQQLQFSKRVNLMANLSSGNKSKRLNLWVAIGGGVGIVAIVGLLVQLFQITQTNSAQREQANIDATKVAALQLQVTLQTDLLAVQKTILVMQADTPEPGPIATAFAKEMAATKDALENQRKSIEATLTAITSDQRTQPAPIIQDEFDNPQLSPLWYWIREDHTHWNLDKRPGWMQIITQAGEIWRGHGPDVKNILLQDFPDSLPSFEIATKLSLNPIVNWQSAGLIFYKDDSNYVVLFYGYHTEYGGKCVRFQSEEKDVNSEMEIALNEPPQFIYLKIVKVGDDFTGYFSSDNSSWTRMGNHINRSGVTSVGLIANNGTDVLRPVEAAFDYFRLYRR